eukprot:TRINITY_DN1963_c0_g1_i3.p1 TRINITY_DN1963_c0_g1~~TRINITY_DN1963_c0_g1_i3.p1  ORF type:complete len:522 (+),score=148.12 TRINITY_DN1963_c0_g1_i3:35-1600(+)
MMNNLLLVKNKRSCYSIQQHQWNHQKNWIGKGNNSKFQLKNDLLKQEKWNRGGKRELNNQMRAKEGYIFRNGFCFLSSNLSLPRKKEMVETLAPKHALHGSLWISTKEQDKVVIESIQKSKVFKEEDTSCTHLTQLIKANTDAVLTIQMGNESVTGKVDNVLQEGEDLSKGLVLIKTEKAVHSLPLSRVTGVLLPLHPSPDLNLDTGDSETEQQLVTIIDKRVPIDTLRIRYTCFDSQQQNALDDDANARLNYITSGITWIPEYRLDISPSDNSQKSISRLSLKALVMNDSEDIYIEEMIFVNGSPHMQFIGVTDPLIGKQSIQQFFNELSDGIEKLATGQQQVASKDSLIPLTSSNRTSQVSLKKGDRYSVGIFSIEVPSSIQFNYDVIPTTPCNIEIAANRKIHLQNNTNHIWVEGSIFVHVGEIEQLEQANHDILPIAFSGEEVAVQLSPIRQVSIRVERESIGSQISEKIFASNNTNEAIEINLSSASQTNKVSKWKMLLGPNETKQVQSNFSRTEI